jgi:hypothetical protein
MKRRMQRVRGVLLLAVLTSCLMAGARAQSEDVRAQVEVVHPETRKVASAASAQSVVVWLSPAGPGAVAPAITPGHFRMAQKDKSFHPHLLVVPLGSTVAFPNLDPFFHNVFSQFNGKRFDLGLCASIMRASRTFSATSIRR